jgi:hypothetical protein
VLRRGMLVAALATSLVVLAPTARADAPARVVRSSSGLIASGSVWPQDMVLADGSSLDFNVMLVVPQGEVTATPSGGPFDAARPWVHVNVWKRNNVNYTVAEVCRTIVNPKRWSAGALNPAHVFTTTEWSPEYRTTYTAPAWEGTSVDVRCNDRSGYDFYRVTWGQDSFSWLVTNKVAVAWGTSPVLTWTGSNVQGTTTSNATAYSTHPLRVCGHRPNGTVKCYSGTGRVVPMIDGMVTTARPFTGTVPFVP